MNAEMIGGTGQGLQDLPPELLQAIMQGWAIGPQQEQAQRQQMMADELRGQSQQADPGSWTRTGAGTPSIYSANPLGPIAQLAQGYMGGRQQRAADAAQAQIAQQRQGIATDVFKHRAGQGIAATQQPQGPAPQGGMMGGPQQPLRNPWVMGGGFGGGR